MNEWMNSKLLLCFWIEQKFVSRSNVISQSRKSVCLFVFFKTVSWKLFVYLLPWGNCDGKTQNSRIFIQAVSIEYVLLWHVKGFSYLCLSIAFVAKILISLQPLNYKWKTFPKTSLVTKIILTITVIHTRSFYQSY